MGTMNELIVGVDGGNSKTDVAVADIHGEVLATVRGPGSSPDKLGTHAALEVIARLVEDALDSLGNYTRTHPLSLAALLAGLDLPEDVAQFNAALAERFPGVRLVVDNDATAVLLAGTAGGPGVAVVCGAGINAVGRSPLGERTGFLSFGQLSGDWGGGLTLGREALWHAIRDEDGRGGPTVLKTQVQEHFGVRSVTDIALALRRGELAEGRLVELVPAVFQADANQDAVAGALMERLVAEVTTMATVMLHRCDLGNVPAPVVLAGGLLTSGNRRVTDVVVERISQKNPLAVVTELECLPVAGALVAALQGPGIQEVAKSAAKVTASPELHPSKVART